MSFTFGSGAQQQPAQTIGGSFAFGQPQQQQQQANRGFGFNATPAASGGKFVEIFEAGTNWRHYLKIAIIKWLLFIN